LKSNKAEKIMTENDITNKLINYLNQ